MKQQYMKRPRKVPTLKCSMLKMLQETAFFVSLFFLLTGCPGYLIHQAGEGVIIPEKPLILILHDKNPEDKAIKAAESIKKHKDIKKIDIISFRMKNTASDPDLAVLRLKEFIEKPKFKNIFIISFGATGNITRDYVLRDKSGTEKIRRLILINPVSDPQKAAEQTNEKMRDFLTRLNSQWRDFIKQKKRTPVPITSIQLNRQEPDTITPALYYPTNTHLSSILEKTILETLPNIKALKTEDTRLVVNNREFDTSDASSLPMLIAYANGFDKEGFPGRYGTLKSVTGRLLLKKGITKEAEEALAEALLYIDPLTGTSYAATLASLGDLHAIKAKGKNILELKQAENLYKEAMHSSRADMWLYLETGIKLSRILIDSGSKEDAIILLNEELLPLLNREDRPYLLADALHNLGLAAIKTGQSEDEFNSSIKLFDMALDIWQIIPEYFAEISLNKAHAYLDAGLPRQAISTIEPALEKVTKTKQIYGQLLLEMGKAYMVLPEKSDRAIKALEKSASVLSKNSFNYAMARKKLGIALSGYDEKTSDAAENLQEALTTFEKEIYPSDYGEIHFYLGELAMKQEAMTTAIKHFTETSRYMDNDSKFFYKAEKHMGDIYFNLALMHKRQFSDATGYYENAIKFLTQEEHPSQYADMLLNLGTTYARSMTGDREKTMQKAVATLEKGLFKKENKAAIYKEIGVAYYNMAMERTNLLYESLFNLNTALRLTDEHDGRLYAEINNHLGVVYTTLKDEHEQYLNLASKAFNKALKIFKEKDEYLYHLAQSNLAAAYIHLNNQEESTENAIYTLNNLLKVFEKNNFPYQFASIQQTLGSAFAALTSGDKEENIRNAISAYSNAADIFIKKDYPYENATGKREMGTLYLQLARSKSNLQKAIYFLNEALEFFTLERNAEPYALIQNYLGNVYIELPAENTEKNLNYAISAYKEALKVWTAKQVPLKYAHIQNSIGTAFEEMQTGSRVKNLQDAVSAFQNAIAFLPKEKYPLFFGIVKSNLNNTRKALHEARQQ